MRGIPVILHVKTQSGVDGFNSPVYTESTETVQNVLVGSPTGDEITDSITLYGKRIEYMLGIPKGDTHEWEDTTVEFFNRKFKTFGAVIEGIEANVPTAWHKKVRVERFE